MTRDEAKRRATARPAARPNKRWRAGKQWEGQIIYTDGSDHAEVHVVSGGDAVRKIIVAALNRHNVTLRAPKAGKRGAR